MDRATALPAGPFDYALLGRLARERAAEYRGADPFPHIALERIMREDRLEELADAVPGPGDPLPWRRFDRTFGAAQTAQSRKLGLGRELELAPAVRRVLREMNSGRFLHFLTALTGIEGLIPDPGLQGGGVHQVLPGGVLGVHADFTWHKIYALKRRINVLIYLNRNWQESYGGHLQLWSADLSRCVRRILPGFGRCVIFSTSARSFHGHPEPVACPEGTTRRSIAMYYYTRDRNDEPVEDTRATDWRVAPQHALPPVD